MNKKLLILILPITGILLAAASIYLFFFSNSATYISFYALFIFAVSLYTARQSVFIQTSMFWELDQLSAQDKSDLGFTIARDFVVFLAIHGVIATAIYFGVYWLYGLF